MSTVIADVTKAYFAALRAMDAKAYAALFADDASSFDPVGQLPHIGPAAIEAFVSGFFALFTTVGFTEESTFIAGDYAAVKWIGKGVGKRKGNAVTFHGIDVLFVGGSGKIRSVHAYWDPGPVLAEVQ